MRQQVLNLDDVVDTALANMPGRVFRAGARDRVIDRVWAARPGTARAAVEAITAAFRLEEVRL